MKKDFQTVKLKASDEIVFGIVSALAAGILFVGAISWLAK